MCLKRIAWVGHLGKHPGSHKSISTTDDSMEWLVNDWLENNKGFTFSDLWEHDYVDLNRNRDFLLEDKQYDIVVICFVFHPVRSFGDRAGTCAVSPKHSISRWQKRLIKTKARLILAFGGMTEVSGLHLGEFGKYKRLLDREGFSQMSVWELTTAAS